MMARIKNEGRWIARCLDRTWPVASTIVLFDDGSTDNTLNCAINTFIDVKRVESSPGIEIYTGTVLFDKDVPFLERQTLLGSLHILRSPFAGAVRPKERVSEIRDKNLLWSYVKACVDADIILCLDGDEMLSKAAIRAFPTLCREMVLENSGDVLLFPFIYLWDREDRQRVDGIYGWHEDGRRRLLFPRLFTIVRQDEQLLFDQRFEWFGSRGGFHCGSIPNSDFRPRALEPKRVVCDLPIVHFGYFDAKMRQEKWEFYNRIDPNNEFEGRYMHIIGEPNQHAPGPVAFEPWEDV
jgi:glycosyltransferase involved in cell wall biosynthesis